MQQAVIKEGSIEAFLETLTAEHKSQKVLTEYYKALCSLKEMSSQKEQTLTKECLEQWRLEQENQGYAPGTITNRAVRINAYLRYLGHGELCFPKGGKQDLTGKTFGDLTVLAETDRISPDRSRYWKCRCSLCGKEKEIPANQLIRGVQAAVGAAGKNACRKAMDILTEPV